MSLPPGRTPAHWIWEGRFLLGFEESYGYLVGSYVRDKDAVVASMLIAEMTAWHKSQGRTLVEYRHTGKGRHVLARSLNGFSVWLCLGWKVWL